MNFWLVEPRIKLVYGHCILQLLKHLSRVRSLFIKLSDWVESLKEKVRKLVRTFSTKKNGVRSFFTAKKNGGCFSTARKNV